MNPVPPERSKTAVSLRANVAATGLLWLEASCNAPAFMVKVPSIALAPVSLSTPFPDFVKFAAATLPDRVATPLE
jgi:hypothetical protein